MDRPCYPSKTTPSYSAALQSPSKNNDETQPDGAATNDEDSGPKPLTSPQISNYTAAMLARRPAYAVVAGAPPTQRGGTPVIPGSSFNFRTPMSTESTAVPGTGRYQYSMLRRSNSPQVASSDLTPTTKTFYARRDRPAKVPKPPSYEWDPAYIAAGAAKYAAEKAILEKGGLPLTTGNGLLDAVKKYLKAKEARKLTKKRFSGLRTAAQAAVRENDSDTRVADFLAGKAIDPSKKVSPKSTPVNMKYVSKPVIPFNRENYSDCSCWLTDYDDAPKDEKGRPKMPSSPDNKIRRPKPLPIDPDDEYQLGTANGQLQLYNPNDNVSYTQTHNWESDEEKARVRFAKIQSNMQHAGFDKSPFVPKTPGQLVKHNHLFKTYQQGLVCKQVEGKEGVAKSARRRMSEGSSPEDALSSVRYPLWLVEREMDDDLSAVLARPSVWTNKCVATSNIVWPDYVEFKVDGDNRAKGLYGRFMPLPRSRELSSEEHRCLTEGENAPPLAGGGVPLEKRKGAKVAIVPSYDMATEEEMSHLSEPPVIIDIRKVNINILRFIMDMEPSSCIDGDNKCDIGDDSNTNNDDSKDTPDDKADGNVDGGADGNSGVDETK